MAEILWHRRETRRQTEKTNIRLNGGEAPAYSPTTIVLLDSERSCCRASPHSEGADASGMVATGCPIQVKSRSDRPWATLPRCKKIRQGRGCCARCCSTWSPDRLPPGSGTTARRAVVDLTAVIADALLSVIPAVVPAGPRPGRARRNPYPGPATLSAPCGLPRVARLPAAPVTGGSR